MAGNSVPYPTAFPFFETAIDNDSFRASSTTSLSPTMPSSAKRLEATSDSATHSSGCAISDDGEPSSNRSGK